MAGPARIGGQFIWHETLVADNLCDILHASVTLEDALDFSDNLDELVITNKREDSKPLEDNSKRRILNSVKSLYSFAYSSGLIPVNVMAAVGQECYLPAHSLGSHRTRTEPA